VREDCVWRVGCPARCHRADVARCVAAPGSYVHYGGFFEQFSALCGAIAVYSVMEANGERTKVAATVSGLGLGLCAVSFALSQIFYLSEGDR
jgi:hypothetical protein